MHELANIHAIEQSLAMLPVQLDLLPLDAHLIPLVILQITSINNPKVEFYLQLQRLGLCHTISTIIIKIEYLSNG